MTFKDKT